MEIIKVIVQLYLIIFVGYLFGRSFRINNRILSTLSIYITLPALLFYGIYINEYNLDALSLPLLYILIHLIMIALVGLYNKLKNNNYQDGGIINVLSWGGNNGNFGIPVILFLLGEQALGITSLLVLINVFFVTSFGAYFFCRQKGQLKKSIIKVFKLPMIYAIVAALFFSFSKIELPNFIFNPIKIVSQAHIPLQLLLLGTFASQIKFEKIEWNIIRPSLSFKLAIMPLIAYLTLFLTNLVNTLGGKILLIEAATPLAITTVALADTYKNKPRQVAMANILSLILIIITLPILWWLIN